MSENTEGNKRLVRKPAQGSGGQALVWELETKCMFPRYQACSKDEVTSTEELRNPQHWAWRLPSTVMGQAYSQFNRYMALFSFKIQGINQAWWYMLLMPALGGRGMWVWGQPVYRASARSARVYSETLSKAKIKKEGGLTREKHLALDLMTWFHA